VEAVGRLRATRKRSPKNVTEGGDSAWGWGPPRDLERQFPGVMFFRGVEPEASRFHDDPLPALLGALELHAVRESPAVFRAIDAGILDAGLHAEGVEQAVVVVGATVAFVDGDVKFVGAFDEVKRLEEQVDRGLALEVV